MRKVLKNRGFSLVELSVVMTVVGITMAGALDLATQQTEAEKENITEERMDRIEMALEQFLIENQRLPCPAVGNLEIGDANFGLEAVPSSTPACTPASGLLFSDPPVFSGIVPVRTLGLPDDVMFDGWDRRFSYAIDANFANSGHGIAAPTNSACDGTTSEVCFQYQDFGSIIIRSDVSPAGSETTNPPHRAVYVLLSHGENGFGAFRYFGSAGRNANSTDTREQENAELSSAPHAAFDNIYISTSNDGTFDDMIRYKTRHQMANDAGALDDPTLCDTAQDVADSPGANLICDNAEDVLSCEALATTIHGLCLQK